VFVKVLSNVEFFLKISRIFFENFQISHQISATLTYLKCLRKQIHPQNA